MPIKISALPTASTLSGAELIPIVQSGETRQASVNLLLGPSKTTSITEFPVVGNGIADDTLAIQAALTSMKTRDNKYIDFCGLDFLITATIYVPSGVKMFGNGATITTSLTSFVNDGTLSSLTAAITNENGAITGSGLIDKDIEITGFNFVIGSNQNMDGIRMANTDGAWIHHNRFTYQQTSKWAHHLDWHCANNNGLSEFNAFYHEDNLNANGACQAIRNSNSFTPTNNVVLRNNYMYKNGSTNFDEFVWLNGATGITRNCKVLNNHFECGPVDRTRSILTIYPYTNGVLANETFDSEQEGTLIDGNTFDMRAPNFSNFGILLGINGDTKPVSGIIITNNIFNISGQTVIKSVAAHNGVLIANNLCRNDYYTTTETPAACNGFYQGDNAYGQVDQAKCFNNTLIGNYNVAFTYGYCESNYCEECNVFASECQSVKDNTAPSIHTQAVSLNGTTRNVEVSGNKFTMRDLAGTSPYTAFYIVNGPTFIEDNLVIFKGNGFRPIQVSSIPQWTANISVNRNVFERFRVQTPLPTTLASVAIGASGTFTCTASSIPVGVPIAVSGTASGTGSITGYVAPGPTVYYATAATDTTFTLSATPGGAAVGTVAGTSTGLTFTVLNTTNLLSDVSTTNIHGAFSCNGTRMEVDATVTISGTAGGTGGIVGYADPTTYYIVQTNGATTFSLSATRRGPLVTTTIGTPTGLTYTLGIPQCTDTPDILEYSNPFASFKDNVLFTPHVLPIGALPRATLAAGQRQVVLNANSTTFGAAAAATTAVLASVAITGIAGEFSCTATTIAVGSAVLVSGTLSGTGVMVGYVTPTYYYVITTNGTTTFTLSETPKGAAMMTLPGTTTGLTFTQSASTSVNIVPVLSNGTTWQIG